ncbi:MAG: hypothetical protein E4G90_11175 [Gemmatimonadales bacterium]|nr:MAG: hypothetical protein E4G90_11175 [Gemmatimonadales bacterium]
MPLPLRWEYQVTELPRAGRGIAAGPDPIPGLYAGHMNAVGSEGWELVSKDDQYCYWKRPYRPPEPDIDF